MWLCSLHQDMKSSTPHVMRVSHVALFGQQDRSKCDRSRDLRSICPVATLGALPYHVYKPKLASLLDDEGINNIAPSFLLCSFQKPTAQQLSLNGSGEIANI